MNQGPLQVRAKVVSNSPAGDYFRLVLGAAGISERTRPGQFAAVTVGGQHTSNLLRRAFSIYRASVGGAHGDAIEIVFAEYGAGTRWMSGLATGDQVDLVAPLGRPFALPKEPVECVLVGGGYGSAPLFSLASQLRERGCAAHLVLGAATESRLFGVLEGQRAASTLQVTTEDGSMGTQGQVTDMLPRQLERTGAAVVYACGPMAMLQAVAELAEQHGAWSQCAVEEQMACGVGVCMTCVLPVRGEDQIVRMVRSCVEGPVFRGDRVLWDQVGTIPDGALGALR